MDCKKAETFLVEYLYKELSASKTVELEAHLNGCRGCTGLLDNWKAIHQGYQESLQAPQAPPFLKQRILSHAKAEMERPSSLAERLFVFLRPALLIPIAVVALFALLFYGERKPVTDMAQTAPEPVARPAVMEQNKVPKDNFLKTESKAKASEFTEEERKRQIADNSLDKLKGLGYVQGRDDESEPAKKEVAEVKNADTARIQEFAKLKQEQPAEQAAGGEVATRSTMPQPATAAAPRPASSAVEEAQAPAPEAAEPASPPVALEKNAKVAGEKDDQRNSPADNFEYAQANFRENRFTTGVRIAQQAITDDSNRELAAKFYNAGLQYQTNKEYDKAIIQYKLVANNYQTYKALNDVLFRLGECYEAIGKTADAAAIFRQLLKSNPTSKVLRERLSRVEEQEKQREELRSLGYVGDEDN